MGCLICGKSQVAHRMATIDGEFVGYICGTCYSGMARDPFFDRDTCKYCPRKAQFGTMDTGQYEWEPLVCEHHYDELTAYP